MGFIQLYKSEISVYLELDMCGQLNILDLNLM